MKTLNGILIVAALIIVGLIGGSIADHGENNILLTPTEIKWSDGPATLPAGAKIALIEGDLTKAAPFTFRLKLPANAVISPHWHPAIEHVTVLSGTFYFGAGEQIDKTKAQGYTAGSYLVMPASHSMFAWTETMAEETIIQVHGVGPWGITYVNPADDPRMKMK